ncbi:hypothetical protein [Tenacibaculum sp. 190524A02b]|uniref:hypothetical protein n=1 Tax=Tenacibaculum vairaonense TaxID=3137860 RepID=UPI0031FB7720
MKSSENIISSMPDFLAPIKPKKPKTYNLRKKRGTPEDIKICEEYDRQVEKWKKLRKKYNDNAQLEENKLEKLSKVIIKHNISDVRNDFTKLYKILFDKDFSFTNPYSETNEPKIFLDTVLCYFLKKDNFFNSPLLRKDLSSPCFKKGLLVIGGYGNGKTSLFKTLHTLFNNHCKHIKQNFPPNRESNIEELLKQFDMNYCVTTESVLKYDTAKDKSQIQKILLPLTSSKQLYIDDLLREEIAFNFSKKNIFKDILTLRADKGYKTHLSMNFSEYVSKEGKVEYHNTESSLSQFRNKYDGRVHDRIFGMCNIIELSGRSFRR